MLGERLIKLAWIFFEKFGLIFLSTISFYVYAVLLTPEQLGLGVLIIAIVEAIGLIYTSTVEDPMVRLDRLDGVHISTVFWAGLIVSLLTVVVLAGGSLAYTLESAVHWMVTIAALKIPLVMASRVYVAQLRRQGNFKALASRTLLGKILGSGAGIGAAVIGWGAWAVIIQAVLMELIAVVVLMLHERKRIPWQIDRAFLWEVICVGAPVAVKATSWDLMSRGVNMVLGATAGTAAVGVFNMAARLVNLPRSAIYNGVLSYALPVFSRRKHNMDELRRVFYLSTEMTCLFLVPCFLGLAVAAEDIILVIFGEKWVDAIPVLQVLAVVAALGNTMMYAYTAFMTMSATKLTLKAEIICSVIALVVVYFAGSRWGALAGAFALLLRFVLLYPVNLMGLRQAMGMSILRYFGAIYRCLLAAVVMTISVRLLFGYGPFDGGMRLLMSIVVGVVSYFGSYTLFNPRWPKQFKDFLSSR